MLTLAFYLNFLCMILVLYFYMLPRFYTINYHYGLKKNLAWIKANPGFLEKYANRRLAIRINYLVGILFIVFLSYIAVSKYTPLALTRVFKLVNMVFMVTILIEVFFDLRFYKAIPSPDARTTELVRRGLLDYIPMPVIYTGYAILFGILCVYIYGYFSGSMPADAAASHMIHLASVLIIISIVYTMLRYRPALWERLFGKTSRKYECYLFAFALYFVALVNIYIISIYFFHVRLIHMEKIWVIFFASLFVQLMIIFLFNIKEWKLLANENPETFSGISEKPGRF